MQEPWRGTLCSIGESDHYLFTTGFVPAWNQYPGPHIPAPLKIGVDGSGDVQERAREILALTKMNWNSAEGMGRYPITISFARKVGTIMTEIPEESAPNPLYRFYM
jgi:argonaute-like protein implicated in RNA metabolism and viral defense